MSRGRARRRVRDPHLANWNERHHPIVDIDGERWAIKERGDRELLGSLLGRGRLNVAEARRWGTRDGVPFAAVRLAENYRRRDLPISDLDEAVAAEMVFSAWIRRRDTHAFNRAYVRGIPVFFDHGAAFDPEASVDHFMRPGPDFGYVPTWRAVVGTGRPRTLKVRRQTNTTNLALHPIEDRIAFVRQVESWVAQIGEITDEEIATAVDRADLGPGEQDLLRRSRSELPGVMDRIMPIVLDGESG